MNPNPPTVADLFAQLGLPNEEADIQAFVATHRPLPGDQRLADAPFWTESQARFLRDEFREDADWAPVVDQLNLMLHD
ncbi:MAG TPA: DUF2789 domain-containing protein [Burkholderiaceae bacterium]